MVSGWLVICGKNVPELNFFSLEMHQILEKEQGTKEHFSSITHLIIASHLSYL